MWLKLAALLISFSAFAARDVRYVVIHKAGAKWVQHVPMLEQPYIQSNPDPSKSEETHLDYYHSLLVEGKMSLGGPMLDAADPATKLVEPGRQVGMMVSAGGLKLTIDDWNAIAARDPAVKAGVLTAEVREWTVAMKAK